MNRRQLLTTLAAAAALPQLDAQPARAFRFRSGLVAYSYRKELAAKRHRTAGDCLGGGGLERGAEYSGSKGILLGVENDYGLTLDAAPVI